MPSTKKLPAISKWCRSREGRRLSRPGAGHLTLVHVSGCEWRVELNEWLPQAEVGNATGAMRCLGKAVDLPGAWALANAHPQLSTFRMNPSVGSLPFWPNA